jgi:hypothetical protein
MYLVQDPVVQDPVVQPAAICVSNSPDISVSNGYSTEYIPYGISSVQALDSTMIDVSRDIANKVSARLGACAWVLMAPRAAGRQGAARARKAAAAAGNLHLRWRQGRGAPGGPAGRPSFFLS